MAGSRHILALRRLVQDLEGVALEHGRNRARQARGKTVLSSPPEAEPDDHVRIVDVQSALLIS